MQKDIGESKLFQSSVDIPSCGTKCPLNKLFDVYRDCDILPNGNGTPALFSYFKTDPLQFVI